MDFCKDYRLLLFSSYCYELLLDSNGTARAPEVVSVDPVTGLLTPNPQCTVLLTSQSSGPVPSNHFLHPETGKVLHVTGNVGYDPIRNRLVCTVDSASGKVTGVKEKKTQLLILVHNFKLNKKIKLKEI